MGLEEIIKNIDSDTRAKAQQITSAAEAEAAKLREDARKDAEVYVKSMKVKAENDAKQLLTRELSKAHIEAKGIHQRAMNNSIEESLGLIQKNLAGWMAGEDYAKLLKKLAKLASSELGSGCVIMVKKSDFDKLKASGDFTLKEAKGQFAGGLIASSGDGTRSVDYSLERILEMIRENIAVRLLEEIGED